MSAGTDGGGDRRSQDGDQHMPDAMTQRLEALAKRLAIEQKVMCICRADKSASTCISFHICAVLFS